MADDSELDWIRDFFAKVLTTSTVKHKNESEAGIDDMLVYSTATSKVWIDHGEPVMFDTGIYEKLHIIELQESSELLLQTMLRNIIDGVSKLNHRETIASYTKPSTLVGMKIRLGNKITNSNDGRFKMDLQVIVKWVTS